MVIVEISGQELDDIHASARKTKAGSDPVGIDGVDRGAGHTRWPSQNIRQIRSLTQ
jgi:hypothetical protein